MKEIRQRNCLIAGAALVVIIVALYEVRRFYFKATPSGSENLSASRDHPLEIVPEPMASKTLSKRPAPTSADLKLRDTLLEVIQSKNDNDPRLDTAFKQLSPEAKELFKTEYQKLAPEKRNERGTIVYLLGRNLTSSQDFEFLNSVLSEPPCLSMADCSKETHSDSVPGSAEEAHAEMGNRVSLAYPQLVALVSVEHQLDASLHLAEARRTVELALRSPVSAVAEKAQQIKTRMKW